MGVHNVHHTDACTAIAGLSGVDTLLSPFVKLKHLMQLLMFLGSSARHKPLHTAELGLGQPNRVSMRVVVLQAIALKMPVAVMPADEHQHASLATEERRHAEPI